jgi:LacI family transcriptional regulator
MLGVRVPDELTIVGFDDIQAAAWPLSDLTTVHADLDGLAHTAVDLLAMEIAGLDVEPRVHRFPVRLVERGTHGRVPLTGSTASTSG